MLSARDVMKKSKVIPVMQVGSVKEALDTAEALLKGGIEVYEITLRTPSALGSIEAIAKEFENTFCGAGTVLTQEQFKQVEDAGANFAISPGLTQSLATYENKIPLIPGAATASEIMQGLEYGYDAFKLFPANVVGGVQALKSLYKPFESVVFCPTGGVNEKNVGEYLALENVLCVGGSWMIPTHLIQEKNYKMITKITQDLTTLLENNL